VSRLFSLGSLLLLSLLCSSVALAEVRLLTSIKPLQLIAAAVQDDLGSPEVLLPPGASPHHYALRPSDVRRVREADLLYWVGPDLESFLPRVLVGRAKPAVATQDLAGLHLRHFGDSGRLLAAFEQIQSKALSVKAGVVQRFYGAASATPGLVMGRLFRTAQYHLKSIKSPAGYQELLEEITSKIGEDFPVTLSLEEQGRFALGYYHQRSEQK
jgi:hypothetical protein